MATTTILVPIANPIAAVTDTAIIMVVVVLKPSSGFKPEKKTR